MQLDAVGGDPPLAVQEVEEPDAGDGYRHVGGLEASGRCVLGVELRPGLPDAGQQRAGRPDAQRVGNLGDHRMARAVDQEQMVVRVALQPVLGEQGLHPEDRGLGRLDPSVGRQAPRSLQGGQGTDRRRDGGLQVDQADVRVGAGLHRPARSVRRSMVRPWACARVSGWSSRTTRLLRRRVSGWSSPEMCVPRVRISWSRSRGGGPFSTDTPAQVGDQGECGEDQQGEPEFPAYEQIPEHARLQSSRTPAI
jgi:hypothetical protein